MPYFVKDTDSGVYKPFANGGTLSLVDKSTFKSGDPNNPTWEITDKWMGHPTVVSNAKNNPASGMATLNCYPLGLLIQT